MNNSPKDHKKTQIQNVKIEKRNKIFSFNSLLQKNMLFLEPVGMTNNRKCRQIRGIETEAVNNHLLHPISSLLGNYAIF